MAEPLRDSLLRQLDTAWALASYHVDTLAMEDCTWQPSPGSAHIRQLRDGSWTADWPPREDYAAGPPSIGWISWHILYWWSTAIDRNFGEGTLRREDITWPGDPDRLRIELLRLQEQWRELLAKSNDALLVQAKAHWPFNDRPLADLFAWANVELTKNAAEIGMLRFLRGGSQSEVS